MEPITVVFPLIVIVAACGFAALLPPFSSRHAREDTERTAARTPETPRRQ